MKIINLLPKPRQQELRYIAMLRTAWFIMWVSLASFVLVFLAQIGTRFYLQAQAAALTQQITDLQNQVKQQENSKVKAQVQSVNDIVSDFKNLAGSTPKWYRVIKAFTNLPPDGIQVNTFQIDPVKDSIDISGFSPTRALVIQLYNNISADSRDFTNIDYPLENVAQPTNINFHFVFYIQPALLK